MLTNESILMLLWSPGNRPPCVFSVTSGASQRNLRERLCPGSITCQQLCLPPFLQASFHLPRFVTFLLGQPYSSSLPSTCPCPGPHVLSCLLRE